MVLIYDKASSFNVKVQDDVMGGLVEVVVVQGLGLVQQH